eukprot:1777951-Amphidinium_carterae.3
MGPISFIKPRITWCRRCKQFSSFGVTAQTGLKDTLLSLRMLSSSKDEKLHGLPVTKFMDGLTNPAVAAKSQA